MKPLLKTFLEACRETPRGYFAPAIALWNLFREPAEPEKIPADLMAQALSVFGDMKTSHEWFFVPAIGLNGSIPVELLKTDEGVTLVTDLLRRLAMGVYS